MQQQKENNNLKHGNRAFYYFPPCHDSANNFIVFTLTSLYLGQIWMKSKSEIIHPVVHLGFGYSKPNIYRKIAKYLQSGFLSLLLKVFSKIASYFTAVFLTQKILFSKSFFSSSQFFSLISVPSKDLNLFLCQPSSER